MKTTDNESEGIGYKNIENREIRVLSNKKICAKCAICNARCTLIHKKS